MYTLVVGPISPTHRKVGAVPHALPMANCSCQVARPHTKYLSPADMQHIWYWSLCDIGPTSLDRTCHPYEREQAAEAGFLYSQLEHGTRSRGGDTSGRDTSWHAQAQSEGVQYRSEGIWDISRVQVIMAELKKKWSLLWGSPLLFTPTQSRLVVAYLWEESPSVLLRYPENLV